MATILIRLALTAPQFVDAALGIVATVCAIALTWAYNRAVCDLDPEVDAAADSGV